MNNNIALRQGNHQVYTQVYANYHQPVYEFLQALTRSNEVAEDIAHNVFLEMWENREELDPNKEVQRYLFGVARNLAMRHFRKKKVEDNYFEYMWQQPVQEVVPEETLYAKEADLLVDVAIAKMPPLRRQIFELFYKEEMSYDLIAKKLNMKKTTVANHLTHAKNDIRKILQIEK